MENIKQWLSPREVLKDYGFSVTTLAKWRMRNKYLAFSKVGKFIKYRRSDIENFLRSNNVEVIISKN